MRHLTRLAAGAAAALALVAAGTGAASARAGGPPATYYVSLGDSLAAGYQPDVKHDTDLSYTDQLYAALKKTHPGLQHIKLGCSGETTTSLIVGGTCTYPNAADQLDAAVAVMKAHRGHIAYVTLDIGANDILPCARNGMDPVCLAQALATVGTNTARIAGTLRHVGGGRPEYAGTTYYNPLLANWLTGPSGQAAATASAPLLTTFNGILSADYRAAGFRVARVDEVFHSADFADQVTLPGVGQVPENVAEVCTLTWMCTPYQDIHPTPAGYTLIADTFAKVLDDKHRR